MLTDGDWSGYQTTCRSTSAGTIQIGNRLIESWSLNQRVVALSTAESEFYAIGSGAARGITVKNMMEAIHEAAHGTPATYIKLDLLTDSNAARGMCHRSGCGRVRHLQIRYLWTQQALKDKVFELGRVDTKSNSSDLGTKPLHQDDAWRCMGALGLRRCTAAGFEDAAVTALVTMLVFAQAVSAEGVPQQCTAVQPQQLDMHWFIVCVLGIGFGTGFAFGVAFSHLSGALPREEPQPQPEEEPRAQPPSPPPVQEPLVEPSPPPVQEPLVETPWYAVSVPTVMSVTVPPTITIAPSRGERYHVDGQCRQLRSAFSVKTYTPCATCAGRRSGH